MSMRPTRFAEAPHRHLVALVFTREKRLAGELAERRVDLSFTVIPPLNASASRARLRSASPSPRRRSAGRPPSRRRVALRRGIDARPLPARPAPRGAAPLSATVAAPRRLAVRPDEGLNARLRRARSSRRVEVVGFPFRPRRRRPSTSSRRRDVVLHRPFRAPLAVVLDSAAVIACLLSRRRVEQREIALAHLELRSVVHAWPSLLQQVHRRFRLQQQPPRRLAGNPHGDCGQRVP